jgi:PAS domain S-box-containing protein
MISIGQIKNLFRNRVESTHSNDLSRSDFSDAIPAEDKTDIHETDSDLNRMNPQVIDEAGGWEYDFGTGMLRWTEEIYKIHGHQQGYIPNFETSLNSYAADSKELLQKAIDKAISRGISWDLELKINRTDGRQIWVRDIGEPVFNNGQIVMLKGQLKNISKQKKIEFSLQVFTELVNDSNESMIVCDSDGNIIYANNQAGEIYGFTKDEMQNLKFQDIDKHRNDNEKWVVFFEETKKNGQKIKEYDFRDFNGNILPVEERSQYSEISGSGYVILFFSNISERKNKEVRIWKKMEQQQNLSNISYLFNTQNDFTFTIKEVIRIAGNFLNTGRVFIFEDMLSGRAVSNTHEWCNIGIESQIENLQAIPYTMFPSWTEVMNSAGCIETEDLSELPGDIVSVLKYHQVISIIAYPLLIDNKYSGFIGCVEAKKKRKWDKDEKDYIKKLSVIISNAFEKKMAMDSLKKSEQRFQEFAELLPEMIFEMNINGKIIFANKLASESFGINQEEIKKGSIFYSLFIEDDRLRLFENFENKIKGGDIKNEQYRVVTIDQKEIPVIVHVSLIKRDKLPTGLRVVLVDNSNKINSEKQLSSILQISEESPYPVLRIEKDGIISICNIKGLRIKTFIEESYESYFKELLDIVLKSGRSEELEIIIAGKYYTLILCPAKDKSYMNIYGKEMTQNKIDNEKVKVNEQRFNDLTEIISEYVWETDTNLRLKYISGRVKKTLDYEPEELIGLSIFSIMHADEEKRLGKILRDYCHSGESFINIEINMLKKNGTQVWHALTGIPVYNDDRKIIGLRGTGIEVKKKQR